MIKIALFSLEADLHAHAILHALKQRKHVSAHFISTDTLFECGGIRWIQGSSESAQLLAYDGAWINVSELDLIWWRRVNQPQKNHPFFEDKIVHDIVNSEWKSALAGIMYDSFHGIWVNDPNRDVVAGNKLYQLNAAAEVGLKVPKTLVSQDPDLVRAFCAELGGTVIVKKLMGTALRPLATVTVELGNLHDDRSIRLCPAIYQEIIRGSRHIRANCFGKNVHSVLIESPILDWRRDLSVPFTPFQLPCDIEEKLVKLLSQLGLRMGVMDLMIDNAGEIVWLELNTQGQFLFAEALSGYDLVNPFADFLITQVDPEYRMFAAQQEPAVSGPMIRSVQG
jgi:hypothetical protein